MVNGVFWAGGLRNRYSRFTLPGFVYMSI